MCPPTEATARAQVWPHESAGSDTRTRALGRYDLEPQRDISRTIEAPPDGAGTESTPRRAADAASSAAGDAASTAGDEAKRAAAEAKDQARSVVGEAKEQVSGLVQQARDELRTQSADRSRQAAGGLRTLSAQLQALTEGRPGDAGPLAGYVTDARRQVASFASRLEDRGIEGVVDDVSRFARRRPGVFLLAAAGAGFVVGRFVRSGVSVARDPRRTVTATAR